MIIGIDASRANKEHKSGTEWYSYHLIKNLAHLDSENEYILYTDKALMAGLEDLTVFNNFSSNISPVFDKKGYQIIKSPYGNFKAKILNWPFSFFWTLGRFSLEMLFNKPDILFVPSHSIPLIIPKKTITTIHDIAFERDRKVYRQEKMGPENKIKKRIINCLVRIFTFGEYGANSMDYLRWSTKQALKRAKVVISISKSTCDEIFEFYGDYKEKISLVYNGYNNLIYRKINDRSGIEEVLKKYEIEKPYLLYMGRLERKKNTPLLIEAYAMAREEKGLKENLVLIGDASYGYDEVKYMIREYSIENNVIMPGWVDEEDMPFILNGANAFIFPSKHEGFGIPVLQAMGCEIPIAASDIAPIREVAQDAILYFDPNDTCSVKFAIEKILLDNNLRLNILKKSRQRIKNFSWKKCAQETLDLMKKM